MAFSNNENQNPFIAEWDTPFGTPPFDKIKQEQYLPAFNKGIKQHKKEIETIIKNTEEPTFKNTIEALDYSGSLLTKVSNVFYSMTESMSTDELQAINKEVSPMLSKHNDDIFLNPELFKRIKSVYDHQKEFDLNKELILSFFTQLIYVAKNWRAALDSGRPAPDETPSPENNSSKPFGLKP